VFENTFGKGRVVWGRTLREILTEDGIGPDFVYTSEIPDADIDFVHRRTDAADLYFVSNKQPRESKFDATFRAPGRIPELWCPVSGERRRVASWQATEWGVRLPITLPANGAVFVVFQDPSVVSDALPPALQAEPSVVELEGPWDVDFTTADVEVTLETLSSWTTHEMEAIRHYSGIARYTKEIEVQAEWLEGSGTVALDLGKLWNVARVSLNGQEVATLWAPPYRVQLNGYARAGRNTLEVEVANTWANRLVGDALLPEAQRRTRTNITGSGTERAAWKYIPLRDSGLFGPVRLLH
jgi:hypothetical protein